MQVITKGHLANNGGIRGHSAGEFYPYRIMAQGKLDSLTWWVINPNGTKEQQFNDSAAACTYARLLHSMV